MDKVSVVHLALPCVSAVKLECRRSGGREDPLDYLVRPGLYSDCQSVFLGPTNIDKLGKHCSSAWTPLCSTGC